MPLTPLLNKLEVGESQGLTTKGEANNVREYAGQTSKHSVIVAHVHFNDLIIWEIWFCSNHVANFNPPIHMLFLVLFFSNLMFIHHEKYLAKKR